MALHWLAKSVMRVQFPSPTPIMLNKGEKNMRLWHEEMIPYLSRQHLLGQHRECCALRGNGWGRKHSTVQYVFNYSPYRLYIYHIRIMMEMNRRGYKPDKLWLDKLYRGKTCEPWEDLQSELLAFPIYPEHNETYLQECIENLKQKGFNFQMENVI